MYWTALARTKSPRIVCQSRRRLATALALILSCTLAACGSDGVCGPEDAPQSGVAAMVAGEVITFGAFTSSPNNDCPPSEGGPTSLTLDGLQTDPRPGMPFHMTFCLPRPARISENRVSLDNDDLIEVVNINAELANGCILLQDRASPPIGTVEFSGYCGNGSDPSGYAVHFDGSVPGTRMCPDGSGGMTSDSVTIQLSGAAAVQAENP
ncbi:MAG: hypothetical protein MJE77_35735 [Proteobacteria bacterium]|nr:hypothetical protein [Pseudomonadota bacterium]